MALRDMMTRINFYFRRFLMPGESMAAMAGLASCGTLLLTVIAVIFWWSVTQREGLANSRRSDTSALSALITKSAESMLENNDISALRRLTIQAVQDFKLSNIRIELPDGSVIADSDPARINTPTLPETWPKALGNHFVRSIEPGTQIMTSTINISGRGTAQLEISIPEFSHWPYSQETTTGAVLIAVVGLVIQLLIYRLHRRRILALGMIRDSLMSLGRAEFNPEVVRVNPHIAPEAQAWNELLSQTRRAKQGAISDRAKQVFGQRRESGFDLENAVDNLSLGIILVDNTSKIRHANGAAAKYLRKERSTMVGSEIAQLIDHADIQSAMALIAGGEGLRKTVEVRSGEGANGTVLRIHIRPLRKEDNGGALITVEDITQQRIADASRNSFVAQVTHELRQPLTNMRMCLEEALETTEISPIDMARHINLMNQETRRLERMVGDMLSVAEIEAGSLRLKYDDVKLDKVFEELKHDFAQQAIDKRITLEFDLPPKYPIFYGDRDKLMLTLHNVIGNAIKYTPVSGHVKCAVVCEAMQLRVDITDSGIGIGAEDQMRIFERFYRAKDPRVDRITGSGMGLTLARDIARLHGGEITVQSEMNKGSTFTVTLPIRASAAKAA